MNEEVSYELSSHRGKEVIFIRFLNSPERLAWVRSLIGARWSKTQKSWYVIDNQTYRKQFGLPAHEILYVCKKMEA